MSSTLLQLNCNRCDRICFGEKDFIYHMMMTHRRYNPGLQSLTTINTNFQAADIGYDQYDIGKTYATQELIDSKSKDILSKIDKYFEDVQQKSFGTDKDKSKRAVIVQPDDIIKPDVVENEDLQKYRQIMENDVRCDFKEELCKVVKKTEDLQANISQLAEIFNKFQHKCDNHFQEITCKLESKTESNSKQIQENSKENYNKAKINKVKGTQDKYQQLAKAFDQEQNKCRQLEGINSPLKTQVKSLRSKSQKDNAICINKYEKQIEDLKRKCNDLKEGNASLKEAVEQEKIISTKYLTSKDDLQKCNDNLRLLLEKSDKELQKVRYHLDFEQKNNIVLKDKAAVHEVTVDQLKNDIKLLKQESEKDRIRINKLINEIQLSKKDILNKDCKQKEMKELQDKCSLLQNNLNISDKNMILKHEKILSYEEKTKELEIDNDKLQLILNAITEEKSALQEENQALEHNLKEYKILQDEKMSSCEERKKAMKTESDKLHATLKAMTEEKSAMQEKNRAMEQNLKEYQNNDMILQASLSEVEHCKALLIQEKEQIQQQLTQIEKENYQLKESIFALEAHQKMIKTENTSINKDFEGLKNEHEMMKEKLISVETEKIKLHEELSGVQNGLSETENQLLAKESLLVSLDVKCSELEYENEDLDEQNAQLMEEISGYKELCADYDDLMLKNRKRIEEIGEYKEQVETLKKSEKENVDHLSVLVREGKKLGEEIGRLEEEKLELENELDRYRSGVTNKTENENELAILQEELKTVLGQTQLEDCEFDVDNIVRTIRVEIEKKDSEIEELDNVVKQLRIKTQKMEKEMLLACSREKDQNEARKEKDAKIVQMQYELDELKRSASFPTQSNSETEKLRRQLKAAEKKNVNLQLELNRMKANKCIKDKDDFEENEYFSNVKSSADYNTKVMDNFEAKDHVMDTKHIVLSQKQRLNGEDFYQRNSLNDVKQQHHSSNYNSSQLPNEPKVLARASKLAPLNNDARKLSSHTPKNSLLGPLPPITKVNLTAKQPRTEKIKNNEGKLTSKAQPAKKGKPKNKNKLGKGELGDEELGNDDINSLLDSLL